MCLCMSVCVCIVFKRVTRIKSVLNSRFVGSNSHIRISEIDTSHSLILVISALQAVLGVDLETWDPGRPGLMTRTELMAPRVLSLSPNHGFIHSEVGNKIRVLTRERGRRLAATTTMVLSSSASSSFYGEELRR